MLKTVMTNDLEYEGYSARVEFDPDDDLFVGRFTGINDVISFHGFTIAEMESVFHEAVEDYVATLDKTKNSEH